MDRPWPLLLNESELCRMLSMQAREVRRCVTGGALPAGRNIFGVTRWHLGEVQDRLAQVFGLDTADRLRRERKAEMEAILVGFEEHYRAKTPRPKKP